jgi:hypothetical protein
MRTNLLEADPEFKRYLPPDSVRALKNGLQSDVMDLDVGPWAPPQREPERGHLGFLLLEGMLIRRTTVDGSRSAELLNRGDIVRPWLEDPISFCDTDWLVVEPTRLAVLDRNLTMRLCSRPELAVVLMDKELLRSRSLAINAATETVRGLDRRLLVLFWHLAERWGRREDDAVVIPLRLTHETLSLLVGARRPSVTTALSSLAADGSLTRESVDRWVLRGEPPAPRAPD